MPGGVNGDEAIRHVGKRRVRITGRFFPQGTGAVANTSNVGKAGWTITRTGVGTFQLTLDRRFLKLVLDSIQIQLATPAAMFAVWGTVTNSATGHVLNIAVFNSAGAAADIAADPNNSISFELEAVQDTVIG